MFSISKHIVFKFDDTRSYLCLRQEYKCNQPFEWCDWMCVLQCSIARLAQNQEWIEKLWPDLFKFDFLCHAYDTWARPRIKQGKKEFEHFALYSCSRRVHRTYNWFEVGLIKNSICLNVHYCSSWRQSNNIHLYRTIFFFYFNLKSLESFEAMQRFRCRFTSFAHRNFLMSVCVCFPLVSFPFTLSYSSSNWFIPFFELVLLQLICSLPCSFACHAERT